MATTAADDGMGLAPGTMSAQPSFSSLANGPATGTAFVPAQIRKTTRRYWQTKDIS
jgi:hypothetical protein